MSQWFKARRQEFIAATLRQFGQVSRTDLIREFGISTPQASIDIKEFLDAEPPNVTYDVSAKAYVFDGQQRLLNAGQALNGVAASADDDASGSTP